MQSMEDLWQLVAQELRTELSEVVFNLWIKDLCFVAFEDGKVVLSENEFKRRIVEQKFKEIIKAAFEKVLGFEIELELVDPIKETAAPSVKEEENLLLTAKFSENTFDTFVVGPSNKFAHAAAMAVAANPGGAYNPLFIYGNSGLGKTHLLSAICHEIKNNNPDANIIFTGAEDFTNELVKLITQNSPTSAFHEKYRNADVLLVDDVQFFARKEQIQEEFFHTFNALTNEGKQIVLSSDRPPKAINVLDERLRTRFEWGLLADIQPPDIETRMAIIKRKSQLLNFDLPDDVVQFMAEKLKNNIRQLEGAVKKMQAVVTLHGAPKNTVTAQNAIKDILSESRPTPVTIDKIIDEVARAHGADPADIRSKKRDAQTSRMRQIAMYIISDVTGLATKAIGAEFGGLDHSTVIYALRKIRDELPRNSSLKMTIDDIKENVQEQN